MNSLIEIINLVIPYTAINLVGETWNTLVIFVSVQLMDLFWVDIIGIFELYLSTRPPLMDFSGDCMYCNESRMKDVNWVNQSWNVFLYFQSFQRYFKQGDE